MHSISTVVTTVILSNYLSQQRCEPQKQLIRPYDCSVRPIGSSPEKCDTYYPFVEYKTAFDWPIKIRIFKSKSEPIILGKLLRLCKMTLSTISSSEKVGKNIAGLFNTVLGFWQGDRFQFLQLHHGRRFTKISNISQWHHQYHCACQAEYYWCIQCYWTWICWYGSCGNWGQNQVCVRQVGA